MKSFLDSTSRAKVLLTSRGSLQFAITATLPAEYHVSTSLPAAESAIDAYVDFSIDYYCHEKELSVRDPDLLQAIKAALKHEVNGMSALLVCPSTAIIADGIRFLWVALQIQDLCMQTCDEDIIKTLQDLPRDLPETYRRILRRIAESGRADVVRRIFEWVLISKRPLTLDELNEAISTEPAQPFSRPERLVNNLEQAVTTWAESLIVMDEEDLTIQFTHGTVRDFLLDPKLNVGLEVFSFHEGLLDSKAGDICVTYLNFSDFDRGLVKATRKPVHAEPFSILDRAILQESHGSVRKLTKAFVGSRKTDPALSSNLLREMMHEYQKINNKLQWKGAFLAYASEYWLSHTWSIERSNPTWKLFTAILESKRPDGLVSMPWTSQEWKERGRRLDEVIMELNHASLFICLRGSRTLRVSFLERLLKHSGQYKNLPDGLVGYQLQYLKRTILETPNIALADLPSYRKLEAARKDNVRAMIADLRRPLKPSPSMRDSLELYRQGVLAIPSKSSDFSKCNSTGSLAKR